MAAKTMIVVVAAVPASCLRWTPSPNSGTHFQLQRRIRLVSGPPLSVIRSGGKQFHAGAWWFGRNDALDARNYFNSLLRRSLNSVSIRRL